MPVTGRLLRMVTTAAPGSPYHRLAHHVRWWRHLPALVVAALGWGAGVVAVMGVGTAAMVAGGHPLDGDLPVFEGHLGLGLTFASVAVLLPATLLAVWWAERRPAGSLSSVTGRLRWGWLAWCLLPAAVAIGLVLGIGTLVLPGSAGAGAWPGWGSFGISLVVLLLFVPVQAAAEEYAFRGFLLQAVGGLLRRPWVPILVQAVLFAALHGWGTPWGFADLVVFGALAGYLTVRTGGLEAAIALHVVYNLVAAGLGAALGQLGIDETAADMPWPMVAVDVPVLVAYTLVVLARAKRRGLAVVSPGGEGPGPDPAAPAEPTTPGRPGPDRVRELSGR